MKPTSFVLMLALLLSGLSFRGKDAMTVADLLCEMKKDPQGIDKKTPRFSWKMDAEQRGVEQLAYQVLVASSPAKLAAGEGDLWNSGKITSSQSVLVPYGGKPLKSRMACFWKVKVWINNGESGWSNPAHFSMGLLDAADWKARWTGLDRSFPWDSVTKMARLSARYFRKEFTTTKEIKKATAYIAGLGLYELYINGNRIGTQVLAPVPTDYSKSIMYNSFDVTSQLKNGKNAIGTILGNGRFFTMRQNYKPQKWHTFGFPKMLLQLEVEYTDGTRQLIVSDPTWKVTADGPIRTNNEYDGEEYDARKEMTGWNTAGFNDAQWLKAEAVKAPGGMLRAQPNENMQVMETIQPVSIKQLSKDKYIMDMGQNMAGWVRMHVKGKSGAAVTLKFAESLQPDGSLYVANLRDALVTDVYTLKGEGDESWAPRFVFHGFRYVEINNYPGTPGKEDFTGEVVYDDMKTTGSFETSNPILNSIHKNAFWGIRSNYKGMPIDCPQRNERQPWLGDRATGAYGESFLFDNVRLYEKWLDDIEQSQKPEGSIPDVAPNFWYYYKDNMTWPGTYLMIADMVYNQFGDAAPVIAHYASMKKWLGYMRKKYMSGYIINKDSYGDWCVPPESPELIHSKDSSRITEPQLLATAYYCHMLALMQKFAGLAGKTADKQAFASEWIKVRDAFNKKFFNLSTAQYSNNTVTANLLPLAFDLVPEPAREKVFQHITGKIMDENKGHISTGVVGTQWIMRWLTYQGRPDIAYKLATITTYPGWGYMVENGATTIWELWNGNTANPAMNSQNHVMLLGDLLVWMYENLAGIRSTQAGFKQIEMKPSFVEGLDHVNASYQTPYGTISSRWKKEQDHLKWEISIPGNTKALVYFPAAANDVKERGKPAAEQNGIRFIKMEAGKSLYELGSGSYSFDVVNNGTAWK